MTATRDPDDSERPRAPGAAPAPTPPAAQPSAPIRFEGPYVRLPTSTPAVPTARDPVPVAPAQPGVDPEPATGGVTTGAPPQDGTGALPSPGGSAPDLETAIVTRQSEIQGRLERFALNHGVGVRPETPPPAAPGAQILAVAAAAVTALVVVLIGYLAIEVPGPWFTDESPRAFTATEIQLMRGTGTRTKDAVLVRAPAEDGLVVVSLATDLRADRFRGIAWDVSGLPEGARARVLWLSDANPGRMQSLPAVVEAGGIRPVVVADDRGWIGRIKGLGLSVSVAGPPPMPVEIRGVTAKPMGAIELLGDRLREWFAFEGWNGASVNVLVGGADRQDLPLPALAAAFVALGSALVLGLRYVRPDLVVHLGAAVGAIVVVGWLAVDLRWAVNLGRQVAATVRIYGGQTDRDKQFASPDSAVYEFVAQAREVMPPEPQRVWIATDAPYFNGRAAYRMYPHNVHFDPRGRSMPEPSWIKPGDWMLVFNRRGVAFNPAKGVLQWDGKQDLPAELKASGTGAALFQFH